MNQEEANQVLTQKRELEGKLEGLIEENRKLLTDYNLLQARTNAQQSERLLTEDPQSLGPQGSKTDRTNLQNAKDAQRTFKMLTAHIKPYAGEANEDYFLWWREMDTALRILGEKRKLLKGTIFIPFLAPSVRIALDKHLVGFGDKTIGEAEGVLAHLLAKRGGDPLVRFQEWRFDPKLLFEINLGNFNALGNAAQASDEHRITTWLKAIPFELQKAIAGRHENWKIAGWNLTTTACEENWRRIIAKKELKSSIEKTPEVEATPIPTKQETINVVQDFVCFNCGKKGHLARDCTRRSILRKERGRGLERSRSHSQSWSQSHSRSDKLSKGRSLSHSNSPARNRKMRCFQCKQQGHYKEECPELKKRHRSPSRERQGEAKKARFNIDKDTKTFSELQGDN